MAEFYNCEQAAKAAKCSIYHIREAIKSGELKAYRPGKGYLIEAIDLENWIRTSAVEASKQSKQWRHKHEPFEC